MSQKTKPKFDPSQPFEAEKPAFDPTREFEVVQDDDKPSALSDFGVKLEENVLFGARPFAAGVGGGVGGVIERMGRDDDSGLLQKLKESPEAFQSGFIAERQRARDEEDRISKERPMMSALTAVGAGVATAPLFAAKGLQAAKAASAAKDAGLLGKLAQGAKTLFQGSKLAAKQGAAIGAANALGHADNAAEAGEMILGGTLLGAGTNVAANAGMQAAKASGKGLLKAASALTGVSENEIKTYLNRNGEVKKVIQESGGDISDAADQFRENLGQKIQGKRQELNAQISAALDDPKYANVQLDAKPVLQKLEDSLSRINKRTAQFKSDEINELKNVIDMTKEAMDANGQVDLRTMQDLKESLQKFATPSYNNGQTIFAKGDLAARASKGAAAEARRLVNKVAPEIKEANSQLSLMHTIESRINKGLLAPGKPEGGLLAAGRGDNLRNRKMLGAIDKLAGTNAVVGAENLAAAKTFAKPPLLPMDATGKSLTRMAAGAAGGYIVGGQEGSIAGAALTSPFALRTAMDAGLLSRALVNKVGAQAAMQKLLETEKGRAMLINLIQSAEQAKQRNEKQSKGLLGAG